MSLGLLLALTGAGCAVVTPPPMVMLHDPVVNAARGGGSLAITGGLAGGVFINESLGAQAQGSFQVTDGLSVEASGGGGARLSGEGGRNIPTALGFGRVGLRHRAPGRDWLTLRAGLGGGASDTDLGYATADVGASIGRTYGGWFRPYAGLALALSVPVGPGAGVIEDTSDPARRTAFGTTFWCGGGVGATARLGERVELGLEGTLLGGASVVGEDSLAGSVTTSLRWTFGPTR